MNYNGCCDMSFVWPACRDRGRGCAGGGGQGEAVVWLSGMSRPLLPVAATASVAATPVPRLAGFAFNHSQTVQVGECSPLHLTCER